MMGRSSALACASTASTGAKSKAHAGRSSTFASAHSRSRSIRSIPDSLLLPALDTCSQLSSRGEHRTSSAAHELKRSRRVRDLGSWRYLNVRVLGSCQPGTQAPAGKPFQATSFRLTYNRRDTCPAGKLDGWPDDCPLSDR